MQGNVYVLYLPQRVCGDVMTCASFDGVVLNERFTDVAEAS